MVISNRIRVAKGYEAEFEARFRRRLGMVENAAGFVRSVFLKPLDGERYVVQVCWESREAFEVWSKSDAFKQAHADRPPAEMFAGPNVVEFHEVLEISEKA